MPVDCDSGYLHTNQEQEEGEELEFGNLSHGKDVPSDEKPSQDELMTSSQASVRSGISQGIDM